MAAAFASPFGQFLRHRSSVDRSSFLRLLDADFPPNEEKTDLNQVLTQQTQELLSSAQTTRDHIANHPTDSLLCILHISRSLLNTNHEYEQMVQDCVIPVNCECALDLLLFGEENIADVSLTAWALLFDTFPVETWIQVLRILCLYTEIVPEKQRLALLWDQSIQIKSVMEDLPWNRYCSLASLIQVLQRDTRNRKHVAWLFGSWLLLDTRGRTVRANVERAGEVMLTLLSEQQQPQQQRGFSWESTMSLLLRSTNQSFRNLIPVKKSGDDSNGLQQSSRKMLEDARDRPARHRDSIERIYGVTPSPPPPKSKLSSSSNSPPPAKSSKLSTKSSFSSDSELATTTEETAPAVMRTPPKFVTAAPLSTATSPYARTSYNRSNNPSGLGLRSNSSMLVAPPPLPNATNKPAFVLKPAVVAATPRQPVNHSRMPPPRPMAAATSSHAGNTYVAALQAARRRGSSKETI